MAPPVVDLYDPEGSDTMWELSAQRAEQIAAQLQAAARFVRMLG